MIVSRLSPLLCHLSRSPSIISHKIDEIAQLYILFNFTQLHGASVMEKSAADRSCPILCLAALLAMTVLRRT